MDFITRKNIAKISLAIALAFNLDRIILGPFAPIRVSDAFNITYPFLNVYINNVLKYGLVSQSPEWICGVTNSPLTPLLNYVVSGLVLPPYINYLLYAIVVEFIAFLGMFLLLQDGFKVNEKASFIVALFFTAIPTHLPEFSTVAGIPLLVWSLDKISDHSYSFKTKVLIYSYIVFYFSSSIFIHMSFVIVPFYFSYFLFVSKNPRGLKNVIILCLIFSLYLLIYLPPLSELYFHSHLGHRSSWHSSIESSWVEAVKQFVGMVFYINMTDGAAYSMPSLLGLLLVVYFIISSEKPDRDRYFYFSIIWMAFILLFAYFIFISPLWAYLKEILGVLKSFSFKRFYYVLMVVYAILIGLTSQRLMERSPKFNKKCWIISGLFVLTYIISGFVLISKGIVFGPEHWTIKLNSQLMIQLYSLIVFLILLAIAIVKQKGVSLFTVLFIPFLLFSVLNTIHLRTWWGSGGETYYNHFYSNQIERVKEAEKDNIDNFRVVSVGGKPEQLLHNGFKCADGYYALYPQTYKEFWAKVIEPVLRQDKGVEDLFLGSGNYVYLFNSLRDDKLNFNLDLLRLINVKYLFCDSKIKNYEDYGLMEVLTPERGHSEYPVWVKWFEKAKFYVYQNKEFAPQVFLTDSMRVFGTREKLLDELGSKDFDYLKANTFVLKEDVKGAVREDINVKNSEITNYKLTPDWIKVSLKNQYPVILNWTRNYNTNWHCWVDGSEVEIFRIYNSFMGAVIPANSSLVEFRYINDNLTYAYIISILGFVTINVVVVTYLKKTS